VVIDEIETLLDKFLGDFMENKKKIWNIFIELLRNAKKVILLDAFITTKTIDFIQSIDAAPFKIYRRLYEPSTRTVKYVKSKEIMINDMIQKLKNGNKIFVFYPHKTQSKEAISMETLSSILTAESKQKGTFYHADVDEKRKSGLKNVNESWKEAKFIITNSVITCGINYENEDFDYAYIFTASFNTPRDIIQVSYRARFLSSGIINVCFIGHMNQINSWVLDNKEINCSLYDRLIDSILCEKKSPLKRTLQLFCQKANYRQDVDKQQMTDELEKYFKRLVDENINLGFSYDSIDEIKYDTAAETIQQRIFSQEATMYEKIMLQKYYFQKQFQQTALDEKNTLTNDSGER
jgi:hypothetical protein